MISEIMEVVSDAENALVEFREATRDIERLAWRDLVANDVLPHKLSAEWESSLNKARASVGRAESQLVHVRRMWFQTLEHMANGRKLERGEFYLCMSAELFGFSDNDYERYLMLLYKDDERQGFINPARVPAKLGKLGLSAGILPEDVRASHLSDTQREFFKTRLPEVWQRFKHKE